MAFLILGKTLGIAITGGNPVLSLLSWKPV